MGVSAVVRSMGCIYCRNDLVAGVEYILANTDVQNIIV